MIINSFQTLKINKRHILHGVSGKVFFTANIVLEGKISINSNNSIYFVYNSNEKGNSGVEKLLGYNSSICLSTEYGIDTKFKLIELDIF